VLLHSANRQIYGDLQKAPTLLYFRRKWKERDGWGWWDIVGCYVLSSDPWYVFVGRRVPGGQINQHMCAQCGDSALSRRVVYVWVEMFKNGHTSVTDGECSGHPTTATTVQNEERAMELIWFFKTEMWQSIKLQKNWMSALGLPILWCLITFSSVKCVSGGYLGNCWISIRVCA
jgi:hypothetical protein